MGILPFLNGRRQVKRNRKVVREGGGGRRPEGCLVIYSGGISYSCSVSV